jgi:CRP-like cAMP-binding protein
MTTTNRNIFMNHVSFLQMTLASCDKLSSRLMLESIGASELVVHMSESLDTSFIVLTGSATVLRPAAAATTVSSGGTTGAAAEATEAQVVAAAAEPLVRAGTLQPGDVFGMQVLFQFVVYYDMHWYYW